MALFEHNDKTLHVMCEVLTSGNHIPTDYSRDGQNISPPIQWTGRPDAKCYALMVDDPDSPGAEPFVHWVMWNIPSGTTALPHAIPQQRQLSEPRGAMQGKNDFGDIGYDGPAPPKKHGTHHYRFRVLALREPLNLQPGASARDMLSAVEGKVTAWGEVVGTYERP